MFTGAGGITFAITFLAAAIQLPKPPRYDSEYMPLKTIHHQGNKEL